MAEVIGLAASIISIVQIADRVIGLCKSYLESVHDAPSDLRSILIETSMMKAILENVNFLVSCGGKESTILDHLSSVNGPIQNCQTILVKMEGLFPSGYHQRSDTNTSKRQKVKASLAHLAWPLKGDQPKKLVEELGRAKMTISLVLTVQSTHDIKDIRSQTRVIHAMLSDDQRDKIYQWLQITDPTLLHEQAYKKYEAETGNWMLGSQEWTNWLDGTDRCVWIYGIPGAGKTILASRLIENIKGHRGASTVNKSACVYYYCSFIHKQDEARPFLRWVINKLCRQAQSVPTSLDEAYQHGGTPNLKELLGILEATLEVFDRAYVVIDAIDESMEPRDELLGILKVLTCDPRFSKIQLLATSRQYNDIEKVMKTISIPVSMMNPLLDEDIRLYVGIKLANNQRFKHWPQPLLNEVLEVLPAKAKGMFRWVVCQIYTLERLKPDYDIVRNALAYLPKTLDETYERIFQAIPEEYCLAVQYTLKWIYYYQEMSARGISIPVLLQAIERSISDLTSSRHEYFLDEDYLRDACGCLITITPKSSFVTKNFSSVSFAHFTVWEFVNSARILNTRVAFFAVIQEETRMELACTAIREALNAEANNRCTDGYYNRHIGEGNEIAADEHFNTFCTIMSIFSVWKMGREISMQDDLRNLAFEFLDPSRAHFPSMRDIFCNIWDYITPSGYLETFELIEWPVTSEYTEAAVLICLLQVDETCELARKFIDQIDIQKTFSTQLDIEKIRSWDHEKNSEMFYKFHASILELFAQLCLEFWVPFKFLLDIGTAFSDPSSILISYLGASSGIIFRRDDYVLPRLLQLGADVNCSRFVATPLQIAAACRESEAVRMLLEAGADPNYTGSSNGIRWEEGTLLSRFNLLLGLSPLDLSCLDDKNEIKSLLLQYGAESRCEADNKKRAFRFWDQGRGLLVL